VTHVLNTEHQDQKLLYQLSKTWGVEAGKNARRRIKSHDEIGGRLARGPKSRRTVVVREIRDEDHRIYL